MKQILSKLRSKLRVFWSIRILILLSIVGLLVIFLMATLYVHQQQVARALDRGDYLSPHFQRFVNTTAYLGGFLEVVVGNTASDPNLIHCLDVEAEPDVADPEKLASTSPELRRSCESRWQELSEKLDAAFNPELILLTDADDRPVGAVKESITAEKLRRNLFYLRASQGQAESAWVELDGDAYVMAGAPVKNTEGKRVGTVVTGISLERLFFGHGEQSSANRAKWQKAFFVVDGRCLASAFKTKEASRDVLAAAIKQENRTTGQEGGKAIEVLQIGPAKFDFHTKKHSVFSGSKVIEGDLVMSRQRAHFRDRQLQYSIDIYWTGGIGLVLGMILAIILAASIVHPLRGFILYTKKMARGDGDLTHRFPVKGYTELAQLAKNLNAMLDQLQFLFNRVKQSSLEVGNSATEISVTASQLHQRSQEQSIKIEDITTAINEMNQMIQQLAANATEAADHARRGSEAVSGASSAIVDIRKVVVDSSDHVRNLGEHSARISNIVETIRQIADQTSLLALNASIEAAHAGEHGKGFAVVANEVSNLAERVNKSARQIEEQLAQIRLLTEQAVRKMEDGTTTVDSSVIRVDSTFRDLTDMMSVVQEIGEREKEQAQVSDGIARNMEDIFMIVREGLSATEQTVNEGERLKDLARILLEGVDKFKTSDKNVTESLPALPGRRAEDHEDR